MGDVRASFALRRNVQRIHRTRNDVFYCRYVIYLTCFPIGIIWSELFDRAHGKPTVLRDLIDCTMKDVHTLESWILRIDNSRLNNWFNFDFWFKTCFSIVNLNLLTNRSRNYINGNVSTVYLERNGKHFFSFSYLKNIRNSPRGNINAG